MPVYSIGIIAFSDMTDVGPGNPFNNSTVSANGTFLVNTDATVITLEIDDDDLNFQDGFTETGGPQTLAAPVTINGTTYPIGTTVEYEYAINTATGEQFAIIRLGGTNIGMTGDILPEPGQTYSITTSVDGQQIAYDLVACFSSGTLIDTPDGPRVIDDITTGDFVLTRDHGAQVVRWIGTTTLDAEDLAQNPHLTPIRIRQGALGNTRDLVVSPQHCILFSDWRAQLYFGLDNVLVPAKALVNGKTIIHDKGRASVTYLHIFFDQHEIVRSEGIETESLFPGDYLLETRTSDAIRELLTLFPELEGAARSYGPTAYPVMRRRDATVLA